jgi:hypothetical protein
VSLQSPSWGSTQAPQVKVVIMPDCLCNTSTRSRCHWLCASSSHCNHVHTAGITIEHRHHKMHR